MWLEEGIEPRFSSFVSNSLEISQSEIDTSRPQFLLAHTLTLKMISHSYQTPPGVEKNTTCLAQ